MNSQDSWEKIKLAMSLGIIAAYLIFQVLILNLSSESISGKVLDVYAERSGWSRYRYSHFYVEVEKSDSTIEKLLNDDSIVLLGKDSDKLQRELVVGETYTFKVYGIWTSIFPRNIVEVIKVIPQ
jgi:hypothetical protein